MNKRVLYILFALLLFPLLGEAQISQKQSQLNRMGGSGTANGMNGATFGFSNPKDSTKKEKKIVPTEIHQWKIDELLGTAKPIVADTLSHQYQNWHFTEGMNGEYNFIGNLGSPRLSRIFFNREERGQFIFLQPYDYFITRPNQFIFTDTKSPYTNISYQSSGDKVDGDDRFRAYFATSANRHFGVGFLFDYLYGRGRYDNQSTAFTNFSLFSYYRNDKYSYHLYVYNNHIKMAENGGIVDDNYITHPESMGEGKKSINSSDIPVNLDENWNRNENFNAYFSHHYNIGFYRQEIYVPDGENIPIKRSSHQEKMKAGGDSLAQFLPATTSSDTTVIMTDSVTQIKGGEGGNPTRKQPSSIQGAVGDSTQVLRGDSIIDIFVPVTRITHTVELQDNERQYIAYKTPANFYAQDYMVNGSTDLTKNLSIKNTVALSMLEGFNKWVQAGLTAYASYDYRNFTLPDTLESGSEYRKKYSEHDISIGAVLERNTGKTWHFKFKGETTVAGEDMGSFALHGQTDLNFNILKDTVHFRASGFIKNRNPSFYYRHYHSQHYWWDNNLSKEFNTRLEGNLSIDRWGTTLSVGIENIKNYTYFTNTGQPTTINNETIIPSSVAVQQNSDNIQIFGTTLKQNFKLGILHLDCEATYQKSSNQEVLPLPDLNLYGNLYLAFKIAKVLQVEAGADVRYFTSYYAPDYAPGIGQFTLQNSSDKIEIGNYPVANVYLNFNLKRTRFYAMMYHVNEGMGDKNSFLVPHYPINPRMLMLGLSWNFYD